MTTPVNGTSLDRRSFTRPHPWMRSCRQQMIAEKYGESIFPGAKPLTGVLLYVVTPKRTYTWRALNEPGFSSYIHWWAHTPTYICTHIYNTYICTHIYHTLKHIYIHTHLHRYTVNIYIHIHISFYICICHELERELEGLGSLKNEWRDWNNINIVFIYEILKN